MASSRTAVMGGNQLTRYQNVSVQGEIDAVATGDTPLIANTSTKQQLVVRRIVVNVYTSAAVSAEFRGDGALGDPVFNVPATPGVGPRNIDWGDIGYALPPGEGLEVSVSGAGNAFTFFAEVYRVPIAGTGTPAQMIP